jgi:hypothetical protein
MPKRLRQHPLNGPPPRLRRPPRKPRPVIGKINPDPNERIPTHADLLTRTRTSLLCPQQLLNGQVPGDGPVLHKMVDRWEYPGTRNDPP